MLEVVSDEGALAVSAELRAAVERRVDGIRNGTGHWPEFEEVLAELDRCEAELLDDEDDADEDDPEEVEAAWALEIQRRVDEIRNGTAETYALEDVLAEMEERYG
ncbi:MAG TPA: addiction module protein [Longimicrobium sp.]|nr:addiction module protein [Longimicrobium sp.]